MVYLYLLKKIRILDFIIQLLFLEILTSSNYDDDEERLSGRNGLGIKLTNVFQEFTVSTFDDTTNKTYTKKWSNNMRDSEKEKITKSRKDQNFTQVSWIPDFERFGVKSYELIGLISYIVMYDAAMITKLQFI